MAEQATLRATPPCAARYVRMSPQKARRVVDLIRGMPADEALAMLQVRPAGRQRARRKVVASRDRQRRATTRTSTADDARRLATAYVDEGPTLKRFRPRAQGRAYRIRKRTSHITVVVQSQAAASQKGRTR